MGVLRSAKHLGIIACVLLGVGSLVQSAQLKHGDGEADGKKSLGGSGEVIQFSIAEESSKLSGIRIHGSRYGMPEAPREGFLIYILSEDMTEIISTQIAPYSLFERGPEKWVEVGFRKPVAVPNKFWVALDFRAGRSKGVYVSYDSSTDGMRSRVGLPGIELKQPDFAGDWMIEATLVD